MYRKEKLKINLYYNDSGIDILNVLTIDFRDFFNDYLRKTML